MLTQYLKSISATPRIPLPQLEYELMTSITMSHCDADIRLVLICGTVSQPLNTRLQLLRV